MEKSNFKFVTTYLKYEKRKHPDIYIENSISFLKDVIDIHTKYNKNKRKYYDTFGK